MSETPRRPNARRFGETPEPVPILLFDPSRTWARHLRPRIARWPGPTRASLVETDAPETLRDAIDALPAGRSRPILVLDLAPARPIVVEALAVLAPPPTGIPTASPAVARAIRSAGIGLDPWTLVLNPRRDPDLEDLARRLDATRVWNGVAPPPRVVELLRRWAERIAEDPAGDAWW